MWPYRRWGCDWGRRMNIYGLKDFTRFYQQFCDEARFARLLTSRHFKSTSEPLSVNSKRSGTASVAVLASQTRRAGFAAAMWGFIRVLHGLLPLAVQSWWCETSALTGCRGHPRHFVLETAKGEVDKFKALSIAPFLWVGCVLVKQRCHDPVSKKYEQYRQQDHARLVLKLYMGGRTAACYPPTIY